jgi:hypothetical protein
MAYDFLGLVNDISKRLNETELTQNNFDTAVGVYAAFKDSINSSIRHINHSHFFYPFNHTLEDDTMTAGECRYSVPQTAKYVDFNSFRIKRSTSPLVEEARKLEPMSYGDYLRTYVDQEFETDVTKGSMPRHVVRAPNNEYLLVPMPDKAYRYQYEYYLNAPDLEDYDDVPTIPENYRYLIVDGGMYYAYMFRDNIEQASIAQKKFENGIKNMRSILVNEHMYFKAF